MCEPRISTTEGTSTHPLHAPRIPAEHGCGTGELTSASAGANAVPRVDMRASGRKVIMPEVLYLLGEPCVRCAESPTPGGGERENGPGEQRRLCLDHFRKAAAEHFAHRGHTDPALTAIAAFSQGLRGVSLPAHDMGSQSEGT